MDTELLAYLIDGLDDDESRAIERQLEASPELRQRLVRLREALNPLNVDREWPPASTDLHFTTLRKIAHYRTRQPAPAARELTPAPLNRWGDRVWSPSHWRKIDFIVAAGILFVLGLLVPMLLSEIRQKHGIVACQENLRQFYNAFAAYQQSHDGYLPAVADQSPLNVAGAVNVILRENGYWGSDMQVTCPANPRHGDAPLLPPTLDELKERSQLDLNGTWRRQIGGCYAFPLGYWAGQGDLKQRQPLHLSLGSQMPIMADRPPREGEGIQWESMHSPNHAGKGQNVLFMGGHALFLKSRALAVHDGHFDPDIFRNDHRQVAPGLRPYDAVLAPSEACPAPPPAPVDD